MSKVESSARPRASPSEVYPVEKLVAAFVVLSGLLMISVGGGGGGHEAYGLCPKSRARRAA